MTTEDFNRTIEELEEEFQNNNEQIEISDEKAIMAKVNQLGYKATITVLFSIVPYLCLVGLSWFLLENGSFAFLANIINSYTRAFTFSVVGSLCLGTIGRKLFERKYKLKERLKEFSNAETQSEMLEEEIKYRIEVKKANNKNKAINSAKFYVGQEVILDYLVKKYSIFGTKRCQSKEECKKIIEELSTFLNNKNDELDILSTQEVLNEKFFKIRTKWRRIKNTIMDSMLTGLLTMIFSNIFFASIIKIVNSSISSTLIYTFAPFAIGTICTSGYMIKRNKDCKKVFDKFNSELGENALPNEIDEVCVECKDIESKIEDKIKEISIVMAQMQIQKRELESFIDNENQKEQTLNPSFDKEYIIQNLRKNMLETDSTTIDDEQGEKGYQLVLRRTSFNPNNNK